QGQSIHQPDDAQASDQPTESAYAELLDQQTEERPTEGSLTTGDHFHQGNGQEDRHGVVGGRFHLQGGADPALEIQPLALQQGEHRSSIGGADDRAQQQAFQPVQAKQPGGHQAGEQGTDQNAETGQGQGMQDSILDILGAGTHAPIQQYDRHRQATENIDGIHVVEGIAARDFLAGQLVDDQEQQKQGNAQAGGHGTGQNADGKQ